MCWGCVKPKMYQILGKHCVRGWDWEICCYHNGRVGRLGNVTCEWGFLVEPFLDGFSPAIAIQDTCQMLHFLGFMRSAETVKGKRRRVKSRRRLEVFGWFRRSCPQSKVVRSALRTVPVSPLVVQPPIWSEWCCGQEHFCWQVNFTRTTHISKNLTSV